MVMVMMMMVMVVMMMVMMVVMMINLEIWFPQNDNSVKRAQMFR
jgi:hypothetical protein